MTMVTVQACMMLRASKPRATIPMSRRWPSRLSASSHPSGLKQLYIRGFKLR